MLCLFYAFEDSVVIGAACFWDTWKVKWLPKSFVTVYDWVFLQTFADGHHSKWSFVKKYVNLHPPFCCRHLSGESNTNLTAKIFGKFFCQCRFFVVVFLIPSSLYAGGVSFCFRFYLTCQWISVLPDFWICGFLYFWCLAVLFRLHAPRFCIFGPSSCPEKDSLFL